MPYKEMNLLQVCRRHSKLTQSDIKYIANMSNTITISRYEKGVCRPSLSMVMLYHILFDVSFENLLPEYYEIIYNNILEKCIALKNELAMESSGFHSKERIAFLEHTISRLESLTTITEKHNEKDKRHFGDLP